MDIEERVTPVTARPFLDVYARAHDTSKWKQVSPLSPHIDVAAQEHMK